MHCIPYVHNISFFQCAMYILCLGTFQNVITVNCRSLCCIFPFDQFSVDIINSFSNEYYIQTWRLMHAVDLPFEGDSMVYSHHVLRFRDLRKVGHWIVTRGGDCWQCVPSVYEILLNVRYHLHRLNNFEPDLQLRRIIFHISQLSYILTFMFKVYGDLLHYIVNMITLWKTYTFQLATFMLQANATNSKYLNQFKSYSRTEDKINWNESRRLILIPKAPTALLGFINHTEIVYLLSWPYTIWIITDIDEHNIDVIDCVRRTIYRDS